MLCCSGLDPQTDYFIYEGSSEGGNNVDYGYEGSNECGELGGHGEQSIGSGIFWMSFLVEWLGGLLGVAGYIGIAEII